MKAININNNINKILTEFWPTATYDFKYKNLSQSERDAAKKEFDDNFNNGKLDLDNFHKGWDFELTSVIPDITSNIFDSNGELAGKGTYGNILDIKDQFGSKNPLYRAVMNLWSITFNPPPAPEYDSKYLNLSDAEMDSAKNTFMSWARKHVIDIDSFHKAYDKEISNNRLLYLFDKNGKLKDSNIWGKIYRFKGTELYKALAKFCNLQFGSTYTFSNNMGVLAKSTDPAKSINEYNVDAEADKYRSTARDNLEYINTYIKNKISSLDKKLKDVNGKSLDLNIGYNSIFTKKGSNGDYIIEGVDDDKIIINYNKDNLLTIDSGKKSRGEFDFTEYLDGMSFTDLLRNKSLKKGNINPLLTCDAEKDFDLSDLLDSIIITYKALIRKNEKTASDIKNAPDEIKNMFKNSLDLLPIKNMFDKKYGDIYYFYSDDEDKLIQCTADDSYASGFHVEYLKSDGYGPYSSSGDVPSDHVFPDELVFLGYKCITDRVRFRDYADDEYIMGLNARACKERQCFSYALSIKNGDTKVIIHSNRQEDFGWGTYYVYKSDSEIDTATKDCIYPGLSYYIVFRASIIA